MSPAKKGRVNALRRHPMWSKDELKSIVRSTDQSITSICKAHARPPEMWKVLYQDVRTWRKQDPELDQLLKDHKERTGHSNKTGRNWGPEKNPSNTDWKMAFVEELLRTKSRTKAALVTPYSPDHIYRFLTDTYPDYDKDFAELVHLAEMRLVAWAEETMWTSMEEAKSPKDRAWIAKEILKVRDRARWGDKLDVSVKATVQHTLPEQRMKLLEGLAQEQAAFLKNVTPKALPANIEDGVPMDFIEVQKDRAAKEEDIVDAEVVSA